MNPQLCAPGHNASVATQEAASVVDGGTSGQTLSINGGRIVAEGALQIVAGTLGNVRGSIAAATHPRHSGVLRHFVRPAHAL
jgi:hypothetical protein